MLKKEKEVKTSTQNNTFYLIVYNLIKEGLRPSDICCKLNISKQRLQYYLSSLKEKGFIEKLVYGVWEKNKDFNEQ